MEKKQGLCTFETLISLAKLFTSFIAFFNISSDVFVVFNSSSFSQVNPIGSFGNTAIMSFDVMQYTFAVFIKSSGNPTTMHNIPMEFLIPGYS